MILKIFEHSFGFQSLRLFQTENETETWMCQEDVSWITDWITDTVFISTLYDKN